MEDRVGGVVGDQAVRALQNKTWKINNDGFAYHAHTHTLVFSLSRCLSYTHTIAG